LCRSAIYLIYFVLDISGGIGHFEERASGLELAEALGEVLLEAEHLLQEKHGAGYINIV
jgi:hypothetical protein